MERFIEFMKEMQDLFGDGIEITDQLQEEVDIKEIPISMQLFYQQYSSISTPFGYIYSLDNAREMSNREPFNSEGWFCFCKS